MAAWNETAEGAALADAYEQLRYTYQVRLPGHLQSLIYLASRHIGG